VNTDDIPLHVSWFQNAGEKGMPALGDPEDTTVGAFASVFTWRREGDKDGCGVVPARFRPEPDGRHVRRRKDNVQARTAVVLDIEANKKTGEVPPSPNEAVECIKAFGLAGLLYTSHNHQPGAPRYRIVLFLSSEIAPELPAPEVMAETLGLTGTLDCSKIGPQSLFYLPSYPYGTLNLHQTVIIPGAPIMAGWMTARAGVLMAARQAEADRIAAEAQAEAAARRAAKLSAGLDPDDSLIEKIRSRFDLDSVLISHGYAKSGTKYRHPNSTSGAFGADIKVLGGIERIFSHNGTDPLHASNLPAWCGGVSALDSFDAVTILDMGGDRNRAMRELAERFNLTKAAERRQLAASLFRMLKRQAQQEEIEREAFAEGARLGLSTSDVCNVGRWVAAQATGEAA
jgi:hypothetical protein